jgi:uncharacterized protein YecE (DUF72 family)
VTPEAEPDPARLAAATELASRAREPALARNVLFGTAGWTDPSLVKSGLFYPRGTKASKDRLAHYARHFSLVEVDATYYTLLPPEMAERWIAATPAHFVFDVKAHPILTGHPIDTARLPGDIRASLGQRGVEETRLYPHQLPTDVHVEIERRFREFIDVFVNGARLGAVLLQFPPWFQATRGHARVIEDVCRRWESIPVSVEFRHSSWVEASRRERVFSMLRELRASYVVVDEPEAAIGGVPAVPMVTNPELAIVRFHGQNAAGWRRGASVAERFRYLYAPEELAAWTLPVKRLAAEAKKVHAVFNNCVRNYAVVGAKGLSVLLEESPEPEGAEEGEGDAGAGSPPVL